jgi:phenolic acid decarboxylase
VEKVKGFEYFPNAIPQTPKVSYCYYQLVTNVIRAVKINVSSYPWYTMIYHDIQPISIQGLNNPVYNKV